MMGHKICFKGEIWLIVPVICSYLEHWFRAAIPAGGGSLLFRKWGSIALSLSSAPSHGSDMMEILWKSL